MRQFLKPLFVLFVAVVCLTSDTTSSSIASVSRTVNLLTDSAVFVGNTPMPKSLAYRKSTPHRPTRQSE